VHHIFVRYLTNSERPGTRTSFRFFVRGLRAEIVGALVPRPVLLLPQVVTDRSVELLFAIMPPRDTLHALDDTATTNTETEGSSTIAKRESRVSSKSAARPNGTVIKLPHNTPTNTGFRRNTFHWELNFWTFGFLALVYFVIPPAHRIWMQVLLALVAVDAARYYYAKGDMPGVPYTLPFVNLVAMVIQPVRFWAELGTIAMESGQGLCTNVMASKFMIFVTDTSLCREIMTGEGAYGIYAHPNALWLFGPRNLIYMDTEPHKQFRAILTPALFSKEALSDYAQAQEIVCRRFMTKYANQCMETQQPIDVRMSFRAMAAASSQEAFLGPYLTDELRAQLEADIVTFTMGFLSFPFPYLNSGLHIAIQAKDRIEEAIHRIVPQSRAWIEAGNPPRCLMDRWSLAIREDAAAKGVAENDVPFCADDDMARTVLDFLFAAQDATNSALAFSLDVLDEDRGVLQKLREEIDRECTKGVNDIWTKMRTEGAAIPYTAKVANQLLHHKPPVPMIPHKAKKDTTFAGRSIAKGTVLIPSITYSARTSGASVDFLPDRPDQDALFVKTVVFGAGQHKCPGRRYAESLLTVFLAVVAQDYDFERTGDRPFVDEFVYYPTTFPKDCNFIIKTRSDILPE
jgi:sterol 22-desaturase